MKLRLPSLRNVLRAGAWITAALTLGALLVKSAAGAGPALWTVVGVGLALAVIALGFVLWRRRRRRQRAGGRTTQRPGRAWWLRRLPPEQALISARWASAVATLRASRLRLGGKPLRAMPWFLVLGQRAAELDALLRGTGLEVGISPVEPQPGQDAAGGAVCAWWYFGRSVVLTCGGETAVGEQESARRTWALLVRLLKRDRRRAGVDGVVLVLHCAELLGPWTEALQSLGTQLRHRLDALMNRLGRRVPVYLLIDDCEHLTGFAAWSARLPEQAHAQALGYWEQQVNTLAPELVDRAFSALQQRLHVVHLAALADGPVDAPDLLRLPAAVQSLRAALRHFAEACLAPTPYLETPQLRGIYLASSAAATREGVPSTPAFVHDVFGSVLPVGRGLALPTDAARRRRFTVRLLGRAAAAIALGTSALTLGHSYRLNARALGQVHTLANAPASSASGPDAAIAPLQSKRQALMVLERIENDAGTRITVPTNAVERLRQGLRDDFRRGFMRDLEPTINQELADVLRRAEQGDGLPEATWLLLQKIHMVRTGQVLALRASPPAATTETVLRQRRDELEAFRWRETPADDAGRRVRLQQLREDFDRIGLRAEAMQWLIAWPGLQGMDALRVDDFWSAADPASAPRAMLAPGWSMRASPLLQQDLNEIAQATAAPQLFTQRRDAFVAWRRSHRAQAWWRFADAFAETPPPLRRREAWKAELVGISQPDSPYWSLIHRLNTEFAATDITELPPWLAAARQLDTWFEDSAGGTGASSWLANGKRALSRLFHSQSASGSGPSPKQSSGQAQNDCKAYADAVAKLASSATDGRDEAMHIAADLHTDPADSKQEQQGPRDALRKLQTLQQHLDRDFAPSSTLHELTAGPLNMVLTYAHEEAACALQARWESEVLWPLQTAPDRKAMEEQLFGAKGTIWDFVDGAAKPFLQRDALQYGSDTAAGQAITFEPAFLSMLNLAAQRRAQQIRAAQELDAAQERRQQQITQREQEIKQAEDCQAAAQQAIEAARATPLPLHVRAQPLQVNARAQTRPFAVQLRLDCASGSQLLDNLNFPVDKDLRWDPNQCSSANLRISIGGLVLERRYTGPFGVADWVQDFTSGQHRFTPGDFPGQRQQLEAMDVRELTVFYFFDPEQRQGLLDAARQYRKATAQAAACAKRKSTAQAALTVLHGPQPEPRPPATPAAPLSTDGGLDALLQQLGLPRVIARCWPPSPG